MKSKMESSVAYLYEVVFRPYSKMLFISRINVIAINRINLQINKISGLNPINLIRKSNIKLYNYPKIPNFKWKWI